MSPAEFLLDTSINAMRDAIDAMTGANHAIEQAEVNIYLRYFGRNLFLLGAINAAVTIAVVNNLAEKIVAFPTYKHATLQVIVAFNFVAGMASIAVGLVLITTNNPRRHHRLAIVILWVSCVAAPFAIVLQLLCPPFLHLY